MTRRQSLRRGTLLAFAMALVQPDFLHAQDGQLTVPLDAWDHVVFLRKGKRVIVTIDDIFDALG